VQRSGFLHPAEFSEICGAKNCCALFLNSGFMKLFNLLKLPILKQALNEKNLKNIRGDMK